MDRSVIVLVNVFVAGMAHIGVAESFKTPALKQKKITQTTAAGERSISYGAVESLDTEVSFKALPKSIYEEIAKLDNAELIMKKAIKTGDKTESLEWICIGGIDIEYGESKEGELFDVKITQTGLKKYTHEVNGVEKVVVDHENQIVKIGGKDLLAEARAVLN